MTMELTAEARSRLDAHLDAVEAALSASGQTREQRRGIVDDLEAQILDMLAARGETPGVGDVEAVLGQLDPPSAYAAGGTKTAVTPPPIPATRPPAPVAGNARYSRAAIWGFVCLIASLLPLVLLVPLAWFIVPTTVHMGGPEHPMMQPPPDPTWAKVGPLACFLAFISPLALAATVLGWVAFSHIRSSKGQIVGMTLALIDGLFYPVFTVLAVILIVIAS